MRLNVPLWALVFTIVAAPSVSLAANKNFNRISSFPVCTQLEASCNTDEETAAEIVTVGPFGQKLIYTDSPLKAVGFVDIRNPHKPKPKGVTLLKGEPTSVAVKGRFALVAVNSSEDFVNVSGHLSIVNIASQKVVHTIDLGGQPDSISVSPSKKYAAVVIENERDEDLDDGMPPQAPAGELIIVDVSHPSPKRWTTKKVDLTGLAELFPGDPEPEFVNINDNDVAVVTLQENNHIVLVDLKTGNIIRHFSAGSVDLVNVDIAEESPAKIDQTGSLKAVLREPDGVAWINNRYFATADEGDLDGGSRGFTIFNMFGQIVYSSGATLDHLAASLGHYPDSRSKNKGNEPENITVGSYRGDTFLFVNSERSSLVFVYNVNNPRKPILTQVLPAGAGPEGGLVIPERDLLIVASETDDRGDKIRSSLSIYEYQWKPAAYPTLVSANRDNGLPIPWGALSGLAADDKNSKILYGVDDSYYGSNRIFTIDVKKQPAVLKSEIFLRDSKHVLAGLPTSGVAEDPNSFDDQDLAAMINSDGTVNIDSEGLTKASDGGFWVVSEGAGTIGDTKSQPIKSLNLLLKTTRDGIIERVITLPKAVNDLQVRFGFEGVAEDNGKVYVAFQRAWGKEGNPRIGIYDLVSASWTFVFYPLDTVESQNGGWVGLSELTALGNGQLLVLERDNNSGLDAAIKRFYKIDLSGIADNQIIAKTFVRDLISDLQEPKGLVYEKIEGAAVMPNGNVFIVNDNDGVDTNSGETQLINLGKIRF